MAVKPRNRKKSKLVPGSKSAALAAMRARSAPSPKKFKKAPAASIERAKQNTSVAKSESAALTTSFVATAKKWDAEIRQEIHEIGVSWTKLGKKCGQFRDRHYYKGIENPETPGKNYTRFDDWAVKTFDRAASTIFRAMNIVKELTTGPNALPEHEVAKIPQANADLLKRVPAAKRTPEMVGKAQTQSRADFQQTVSMETGQPQTPFYQFSRLLPKDVYDNVLTAIEIGKYAARDDDREYSLEIKAIDAIATEFRTTYEAEFNEWKKLDNERRQATDAAQEPPPTNEPPTIEGEIASDLDELDEAGFEGEEEEEFERS